MDNVYQNTTIKREGKWNKRINILKITKISNLNNLNSIKCSKRNISAFTIAIITTE